jgi:hypothetical protein
MPPDARSGSDPDETPQAQALDKGDDPRVSQPIRITLDCDRYQVTRKEWDSIALSARIPPRFSRPSTYTIKDGRESFPCYGRRIIARQSQCTSPFHQCQI